MPKDDGWQDVGRQRGPQWDRAVERLANGHDETPRGQGAQEAEVSPLQGKRLRCATCKKRSPHKVLTPAPWYCPGCLRDREKE